MIEEYLKTRPNLKKAFLLVDYRHKPAGAQRHQRGHPPQSQGDALLR